MFSGSYSLQFKHCMFATYITEIELCATGVYVKDTTDTILKCFAPGVYEAASLEM